MVEQLPRKNFLFKKFLWSYNAIVKYQKYTKTVTQQLKNLKGHVRSYRAVQNNFRK